MMKKHAYLILTHADFDVLAHLVHQLDDQSNDIYIHFDKKVKVQPKISTTWSKLIIIENSTDIRWGHISMLQAEFSLFESAVLSNIPYQYYHLISGTHYPLRLQEDIHLYFSDKQKNVLMKMETSAREIDIKLNHHNLFIKNFNHKKPYLKSFYQLLWHTGLKLQQWLRIKRNPIVSATKASQWMSLNRKSIEYLIAQKQNILKRYQRTLCADEFFIPSTLAAADQNFAVSYVDDLLFCEFDGPNPKVFMPKDVTSLLSSDCLFARKFNDHNIETIRKLNIVNGRNND